MTEPIDSEGFTTESPNSPKIVPQPSYTCPRCGRTSYNPNDLAQRYCGACHAFEKDAQEGLQRLLERGAEPFWMQDVRLAQRRLEASRLAARSTNEDQAAS